MRFLYFALLSEMSQIFDVLLARFYDFSTNMSLVLYFVHVIGLEYVVYMYFHDQMVTLIDLRRGKLTIAGF